MKKHQGKLSVQKLCALAEVSRSGYYEWSNRVESDREKSDRRLCTLIKTSWLQSRKSYGALRIHQDLVKTGEKCSKRRVTRLMKKIEIKSVHRKKYRVQTTQSNHDHKVSPNIVSQDFSCERVNEKWGCDISYIETSEGWLYLAVVMDFYSRKIIGFSMGETMKADLCCKALQKACLSRKPPKDLIHHSDRGVQYASSEYRKLIKHHKLKQSMSRKGNCYDNAMVESFFHTLKIEEVRQKVYATREQARAEITDYIVGFYNSKRRHSSLDYESPNYYEQLNKLAA